MYEVSEEQESWITSSLEDEVADQLAITCYNLSLMLGDYKGNISMGVPVIILNNLAVSSPGIVLLGTLEEGNYTPPIINSALLGDYEFTSEISAHAYEIYSSLYNGTFKDLVNTGIRGRLLDYVDDLPPVLRSSLCALYLDCYALYLELLECNLTTGLTSVARSDLYRMTSNCGYICYMIERLHSVPRYLLYSLRGLERTLSHLNSVPFIFRSTYKHKKLSLEEGYDYEEL